MHDGYAETFAATIETFTLEQLHHRGENIRVAMEGTRAEIAALTGYLEMLDTERRIVTNTWVARKALERSIDVDPIV